MHPWPGAGVAEGRDPVGTVSRWLTAEPAEKHRLERAAPASGRLHYFPSEKEERCSIISAFQASHMTVGRANLELGMQLCSSEIDIRLN